MDPKDRIIRRGTVDLSKPPRTAHEIVQLRTQDLPEDLTFGEAIRGLQATIMELREQASLERLRKAERRNQASERDPITHEELKRKLGVADEDDEQD